MNDLRTIFEVGSQTEAESMEASKTKVKINAMVGGEPRSLLGTSPSQTWGCLTEVASLEASKTKAKINGGRGTSVTLVNITQSWGSLEIQKI